MWANAQARLCDEAAEQPSRFDVELAQRCRETATIVNTGCVQINRCLVGKLDTEMCSYNNDLLKTYAHGFLLHLPTPILTNNKMNIFKLLF